MSATNNQNSCLQKPCQPEQFDYPHTDSNDMNPDLSGRPVLYTGVLWVGILRKFLIPRPVTDSRPCCTRKAKDVPEVEDVPVVKPTNTSSGWYSYVYPSEHAARRKPQLRKEVREETREQEPLKRRDKQDSKPSPSQLANLVHQVRGASSVLKDEVRQLSDEFSELVQEGKTTTTEKIQTLREDERVSGRYAAITITSMLGYASGMRRSVAVRLVYAATGAVATATLCYPEDALHYNHLALTLLRHAVEHSVQLLRQGPKKSLVVKESIEKEISTSRDTNTERVATESNSKLNKKTKEASTIIHDLTATQEKRFGRFYQETSTSRETGTERVATESNSKPSKKTKEASTIIHDTNATREKRVGRFDQETSTSRGTGTERVATESNSKPSKKTKEASTIIHDKTATREKRVGRFDQEISTSRGTGTEIIATESNSKPSEKAKEASKTLHDNTASQDYRFNVFDQIERENRLSSHSEHRNLQQNWSFQEQQKSPTRIPPSQFAGHEGKLSKECEQDGSRVVPSSPTLPVPPTPEILEPDYFQNYNTYNADQSVPNKTRDDSFRTNSKEKVDLESNSLNDSHSPSQEITSQSEYKTGQPKNSNPIETNDAVPALEPIKEIVTDSSKNEDRYKGPNYPLNKKLNRYYIEKKSVTLGSLEAEQDDLNSKIKPKNN